MKSGLNKGFLAVFAALLSGCPGTPPTESPMPSIETADSRSRRDSVVIMLPGHGDRANTFIEQGFQKAGERWGFDTIAVDAHFGYYVAQSLLPRLHEDVVTPALQAGYKHIWLLGVSMGGYGSLLYASEHPDLVDGVILLAPYLGENEVIEKVVADGGLDAWQGDTSGFEDHEAAVWTWLRETTRQSQPTPIILGYGLSDGMAEGYAVLIEALQPSSVYTLEGGHKWTTWGLLWEKIAADLQL